MAIKYSIGGLCGFGASLLGGKLLNVIQTNRNMIFGINVYGQQVLSAISCLLTIIAIIYTKKVIERQQVKIE